MRGLNKYGIVDPVYEEFRAKGSLKNIIDKYWYFKCLKGKKAKISFYLLPSFSSSVIYLKGLKTGDTRFILVCPILKKIKITSGEDIEIAGALLKPLVMASLFKIKNPSAVNKITGIESVTDRSIITDVRNKMKQSVSAKELIKSLEYFFSLLKDKYILPDSNVKKALELMLESGGNLRLQEIYKSLTISVRQFQRKFLTLAGIKPKEFMRLVRLSIVASNLVKNGYNHFDVLTEAGYYDQSHYDHEFMEIYGTKPTDFEASQKLIKHINIF